MLISAPHRFEIFGAVKIYDLSRVQNLLGVGWSRYRTLSIDKYDDLVKTAESTAIVVPVKDEDPNILEGVLRAIPVYSPILLISASMQKPLNVYGIEVDVAEAVHRDTGRPIIVVHQRDPVVAELLKEAVPNILDEDGLVRYGKGEGVLVATLLAEGLNAKNVGFIDADNYIPGAVLEYSLAYYTYLVLGGSRYKMVRVSWGYKAHGSSEFYFRKSGRVTTIINAILNRALSQKRRVETDIIKTSNSGEHAMTLELAKSLTFSEGFSIETQELVNILEMCYLGLNDGLCPSLPQNVEIYQVESRNPHIHGEKGETHTAEMTFLSLAAIYHSRLASDRLKNEIMNILRNMGFEAEPVPPQRYKYPRLNAKDFLDRVLAESEHSVAYGL